MSDLNQKEDFSKYLQIINPSEINIKKENIFYREKYKEIINYLKLILTESKDLEIYKYLNPKGLLLIQAIPGVDLLEYLKLICSNFYIYYIQFRESTIIENPNQFHNNINKILDNFDEILKAEFEKENKENKNEKSNEEIFNKEKLLVINQNQRLNDLYEGQNLLRKFLFYYQENENLQKLLKNNLIIIWINYDYEGILNNSDQLYQVFDYVIKVPILNKIERQQVFREFMENNPKISFDINKLVELTENWEVNEINHLLRAGILKHYINANLNTTSNEITDMIIQLVESGEFISNVKKDKKRRDINGELTQEIQSREIPKGEDVIMRKSNNSRDQIFTEIKSKNYSEFMLNQLYENAASENYNELVLIIDKLDKEEPLEENDRKLLSKYPFILNSAPSKAQLLLEKAKKRIDMITKSFGK